MDDRFNTIAGWTLFAGVVAMGTAYISQKIYHGDEAEMPEKPGFFVEGAEGGEGGSEMSVAEALNLEGVSASAGEALFSKCSACHSIAQGGPNGIGPNLWGIMGQPIGQHVAGFAYSSALAGKGGVWDWENMNAWLKSPRAFANGTKMSFAGLSSIEDRASISLYLNSMGSSLAVPEFVPEADDAAEGEEGAEGAEAAEDTGIAEGVAGDEIADDAEQEVENDAI